MQPQLKKTLWIVVPSILLLAVVLTFSIIYSISDTNSGGGGTTQVADNILRFPEYDFAFVPPDAPWQRTDPNTIAKGAVIAFGRPNPGTLFVGTVDKLPDNRAVTIEDVAKEIAGGIQNTYQNGNLQWVQQPAGKLVNGIPGVVMVNRADTNGTRSTYVHWAGINRGRAYHLVAWGTTADESAVLSEAENMFNRFHPLDHFPANQPTGSLAEFTSKRYQYVLKFNDPNWHQWPEAATQVPYAELGVLNGSDTCLITAALDIGDIPAEFDTLLGSFARVTGITLTQENTARIRSNTAEGAVVAFNITTSGVEFQHFVELVRAKNMLFIGHGWTSNKQKFDLIKDQLVNNLSFPNIPPSAKIDMTQAEQKVCGMLLNELGITYVRANRPAQGIPILDRALQVLPGEPTVIDNLAAALMANNQPRNAKTLMTAVLQQLPNIPALKLRAALINTELGETAAAKELYNDVFSKPEIRADQAMIQYVKFLQQDGSLDAAVTALEKYRTGHEDSRPLGVTYAILLGKRGDHLKAIALLEQLRKSTPSTTAPTTTAAATTAPAMVEPTTMAATDVEPDLLIALGKEYNAVERYSEATEIAADLIKRGFETTDTYLVQAAALNGTKKYAEAKLAVENAMRRGVPTREGFDLLRLISDNLGQNTKSMYTTNIDAVAIPSEVLAGIPADPPSPAVAEAMGAVYVARVGAVAFEAGKEFRATELQRLRPLTRQGADRISTLEFRFDPTTEAIFVNKIEVKDASGKVVSNAKPEDVFITDAPAEDRSAQRKILRLAVSSLAPLSTVELTVTRKQLTPPSSMRLTRYFMSTPMIMQRAAFVLQTSDMSRIADAVSGGVEKKTYGNAVAWQIDNPPLFRGEPIQPEPSYFVPMVVVGDAKTTWPAVGDEYLATLKAVWPEDPEARTLATRLTTGLNGDAEKIDAIVGHVQKEIAYKQTDFVQGPRVPRKPADVIRDKSGDAKDQAFLLFQLLRAAGFESRLALVSRADRIEAQMASMDQFDHVVVCVPGPDGGAPRFLDVTEKDSKVISPPETIVGSKAFVLQPSASDLVPVGEFAADASTVSSKRQITLENNLNNILLKVQETLEISGPAAGLWRAPLKQSKPEEQRQQIKEVLGRIGINAEVTELKAGNLDDSRQPLTLELTYLVAGRFNPPAQNGLIVGSLPASWERHWLMPPQMGQRTTPFIIRVPMKVESEFTFKLPEKVRVSNAPTDAKSESKFGSLQTTFNNTKPGELSGKITVHITAGRYDKDAYNDYLKSRKELIEGSEPGMGLQAGQ